jgi:hypothetical protein
MQILRGKGKASLVKRMRGTGGNVQVYPAVQWVRSRTPCSELA